MTFDQDFEAAGRFYNVRKRTPGISDEGNLVKKAMGPGGKEQRCGDSGEHEAKHCKLSRRAWILSCGQ